MKLVTYPLDGVTYSAEDVATYLCTRTSGVYSRDSNFAVTVSGSREITVSPGLAWINYDDFKGISVCARESDTLTIPDANDMLSRIDRVVLQFDANANKTELILKVGTPAENPASPQITQTHSLYELCLCEITVPAGSSVITAADITDTRADESLCGLMRDGVTGIPLETLGKQALEKSRQTAALCDQLLQSYNGGYLGIWPVTLTTDGWAKSTDLPGYTYKQTAKLRAAQEARKPEAVPALDSFSTAIEAGVAGVCETKNGAISFWAESVPEKDIQMLVSLLGEMTDTQSGDIIVSTTNITPEQYGAVGDGVADDTDALKDAIAAASEKKQPLELTSTATYRYCSYINLPDDLTIHGNNAVLLSDLPDGGYCIGAEGRSMQDWSHDILLENIQFKGADSCTSRYILRFMRTRDAVVRGCLFECEINDYSRGCLDVYGACENLTFEHNVFRQLSCHKEGGLWVRSWTNSVDTKNIRFLNCDFYKAGGDEVLAVWGWSGNVKDVLISGCNFYEVDDQKYLDRGYFPAWFITLGQTDLRDNGTGITDVRMENCVIRVKRCETIFRMLRTGTHAVVDNCDIYMDQPDDVSEHDPNKSACPMLAQGNQNPFGTVFSNNRVHLRGDRGRKICFAVGALRNNFFDVELGNGPASTVDVTGNTFKGKFARQLFNDCNNIRDNVIEATVSSLGLFSGGGIVEGNQYTLTVTGDCQGGEIFRNNWGSGTIRNNQIALTCTAEESYTIKKYNFPGKGTEYIENNIVTVAGPVEYDSPYLVSILNGAVYRKNNYFNGIREALFECTGVSFDAPDKTEQYKKYAQLEAAISPANCTDPIIYTWDNAGGAVLDMGDGKYRPVKDGTAKATVSCGAFSASQTITVALVPVACESLTISRTTALCAEGRTTYLKAIASPYWTTDDIVWTSDAEDVATVTQDGEVSALKIGSANITVTCGSQTAICALRVVDASELPTYTEGEWELDNIVAYIALPNFADEHTLYAAFDIDTSCADKNEELPLVSSLLSGQTGQESIRLAFGADGSGYKTIRWYTTDASADEDGSTTLHRVPYVNNGFKEGEVASASFLYLPEGVANPSGVIVWNTEASTVKAAPDSGVLSFNVLTGTADSPITDYTSGAALAAALASGDIHATKATGFKLREFILFTNASYSTLDEIKKYRENAEVDLRFDADGEVVNAGTAGDFIIAGKGGEIVPISSVTLGKSTLTLTEGGSDTLTASVLPADATTQTVKWSVSPEGIAALSASKGSTVTVSAAATGECTITATAGGKSAACAVTVNAAENRNSNPFPDIKTAYLLPTEKTFVPANAEYIDTGVKLFETIDPAPTFTILFEAQGAETLAEKADTYTLMHCMEEADPWPGLVVQVGGAAMKLNVYKNNPDFGTVALWKSKKCRAAIRVESGALTGWRPPDDGESIGLSWGAIKEMTTAVAKSLILGAYQESDGTKGRYFDGTLYQCIVYKSALTDEQISGWVNG